MSKQLDDIRIEGMSCDHCVRSVTRALEETDGVEVESVEIGLARVRYDRDVVPRSRLVEAIEAIGFETKAGAS